MRLHTLTQLNPDIQKLQRKKWARNRHYRGEIHGKMIVHDVAYSEDTGNKYWLVWCCNCRQFRPILGTTLKNKNREVCYECKPNNNYGKGKYQ